MKTFDLLPPDRHGRMPRPADAIVAANASQLPPALAHLRAAHREHARPCAFRHVAAARDRLSARRRSGDAAAQGRTPTMPSRSRCTGGRAPFTWLVDGAVLGNFGRYEQASLEPGEGFSRITVIDADGNSATSRVRFRNHCLDSGPAQPYRYCRRRPSRRAPDARHAAGVRDPLALPSSRRCRTLCWPSIWRGAPESPFIRAFAVARARFVEDELPRVPRRAAPIRRAWRGLRYLRLSQSVEHPDFGCSRSIIPRNADAIVRAFARGDKGSQATGRQGGEAVGRRRERMI